MADMQELLESQVVQEEPPQGGDAPADAQVAEAPKRPRVKRSSVKAVENRAAELEQRIEALAEQVAQFSRRVVALEESRHQSQTHGGASHNGGDLAERVRQLDERVQKLANYLTQQNWGVNRV